MLLPFCLSTIGCATKMAIRSYQPGPVSVGAIQHLVILAGEGRRSARETVNIELLNQCRSLGYFSLEDRSEEGIKVRIAGRRAMVDGAEKVLEKNQAGLRVDVLEWNAVRDTVEVRKKAPDGTVFIEEVPVRRGNVLLSVSLFNPSGMTFLAEKEYEGLYTTDDMLMSREDVIEMASKQAVGQLLRDITPVQVVSYVYLDEDDPAQEPIIETALAGNIAQAAEDERFFLDRNPNSAAAAYNLAVFLEAMGQYEEALAMYDRALSLGNKSFYSRARAGCARRLAATMELNADPS